MTTRSLLAAAAAVFSLATASPSSAQITTTIVPRKPSEQAQAEAARREAVQQDSITRVTLTGMKEWVDSAANALAVRPDTSGVPSVTGVAAPPPPQAAPNDSARASQQQPPTAQSEFREGGRAPDTATSLPTLAVAGGVLIVLGALMRRRSAATARTRR
ncbi:MAG TPA: hypothetical protein VFZ21_18240 [Gemmatimonadaceae bacterium]|jgi:hypothetical protein|nr:hypothetical protein [Gemmatimonadaceae bacterium]